LIGGRYYPTVVGNDNDETPIVVTESAVQRDGLFGGLTLLFCVVLVRGVHGASTTAGAIAAGTFSTAMIVGLILLWRVVRRQRSRLVVSTECIALVTSAGTDANVLNRAVGDQLRFVVLGSVRYRYTALKGGGDGAPLKIQLFNRTKVRAACVARGWRFD
jgi:hypothetical protein